jgi:hypothetical protein
LDGWVNTHSYREKLTLVVETPMGEVSASGVRETTFQGSSLSLTPEMGGSTRTTRGEAIPLEVAPGQWVFVLLGGSYAPLIVDRALYPDLGDYVRALRATKGKVQVTTNAKGEPLRFGMVTFLDIDDPTSARFIENGDLEPFFGPGYRIVSSKVEITNEPVTEGRIIEVLDWWMDHRHGPYNEMMYLKVPNVSPRGWVELGADSFWSLDYRLAMTKKWENNHVNP